VLEQWRRCISTGEPFEMEFPLRGADGAFRWFLTRVRPLRDAEGRIVRWFGSNTNIDERRRLDDFRDMFLGILGHDLRNPLSTILITARVLMLRANSPEEIRTLADRITRSGVRMQHMIEQLLDLTRARLTAGIAVNLSDVPADIVPLVTKIVDEVRAAHPQCAIQTHFDGHCAARIDADRLEQVISNLLTNAVTHGDKTRPIQVAAIAQSEAITLSVRNFGPAIDPAFLPLIFSPFARGEKPLGSSEGLGLGLYISERIVHAHGGTLTVQSSQQAGTQFTMLLPKQSP
jgi:signal transduction histidine kinase